MECPVCKTIIDDHDRKECSVCQTDLEIYRLLAVIRKKSFQKKRTIYLLLFLLISLIVAGLGYHYYFIDPNLKGQELTGETIRKQQIEIQNLTNEKQLLMTSIFELRKEIRQLEEKIQHAEASKTVEIPKQPTIRNITHTVKRGENLKLIARKYYGNMDEYVRIMQDNNISNPNHIWVGQRLNIKVEVND